MKNSYKYHMSLNIESLNNLIQSALTRPQSSAINNLKGSSKALIFSLIRQNSLFVCLTDEAAIQHYQDALFWAEVFDLPLPVFIPPQGEPDRIKALQKLSCLTLKKVIASASVVLSNTWTPESLPPIEIAKGMEMGRDFIADFLKEEGYRQVSIVVESGEMSVRGGIIDVFPMGEEEFPVRIEFFGDEIESLRLFCIETQRTVKFVDRVSIPPARDPEGGLSLLKLMQGAHVVLDELEELKRHNPELSFEGYRVLSLHSFNMDDKNPEPDFLPLNSLGIVREERKSIDDLPIKIKELKETYTVFLISDSDPQARRIRDLFDQIGLAVPVLKKKDLLSHCETVSIVVGELSRGFIFSRSLFVTSRDIFGEIPETRLARKKKSAQTLLISREELKEGDYVVHIDYGIGKYLGIRRERFEEFERDLMILEYMGGDRLYVPLDRIDKIQKYQGGEGGIPKLHKLGTTTWQKTRARVKKKVRDMAEEIIKIHASRIGKGNAFPEDTELHREFDGFFAYGETPDQLTAIEEIKKDMEDLKPMDRLLCGDVGYGKTEVAMRAAFKAVYDSKQVAILAPTTILVEQHYNTFCSRFSGFPIRIDYLSRFKSRAEQKETIRALSRGDIDIIIGTHRLLGKDIEFFDLGLLVIDEEQKFGVANKEKLKKLRHNVDVLTLSATPIPRTLHMAFSGIKSISTIETPPADRLAIRTIVTPFSKQVIKEAIQRELDRGGQVFFVHNRVQSIYRIANMVQELLPSASVRVAHGQMDEEELEEAMLLFMRRQAHVLVSTSIISSGLDIPTVNTIIIDRADLFGLADLYQLRGRVGRSNMRAYAYFLMPDEETITDDARKRLEAIQELSYLGAGFRLAMKDLEIRGAGNLLGAEQSGQIEAVGFDMYVDMLEKAAAEIKGEEIPEDKDVVIDVKINAAIPEFYVEDAGIKLSLYRRIAMSKSSENLDELYEELQDRFGYVPQETANLLDIARIKIAAKKIGITEIKRQANSITILFDPAIIINPDHILASIERRKNRAAFLPEGGVVLKSLLGADWQKTVQELLIFIKEITEGATCSVLN